MLKEMSQNLKANWKSLLVADLLYKVVAYTVLVPLVSLIFRCFLYFSGREILADTDIADFFLHPLGWLTLIIVGGGIIGITAFEIGTLLVMNLSAIHIQNVQGLTALWYIYEKSSEILRMTSRIVLRLLLIASPFIIVCGALFLLFLTEFDINYYLTEKPPKFLIVASIIAVFLLVMTVLLIRCLFNWTVALPLLLFENMNPDQSLEHSRDLMLGKKLSLLKWIGAWGIVNFTIGTLASAFVLFLGKQVIPTNTNSVFVLVTTLGAILATWAVVNFLTQIVSSITLALMLSYFYDSFCRGGEFRLPAEADTPHKWSLRITMKRLIAGIIVAFLGTSFLGLAAVRTVRFEDEVEVTAHRGASAVAPENTLASVRQAIADGTDWVEIDVQESKDGIVMVAHDSDLKKVAGNAIKIWEGTADELRSIDIGSYFDSKFQDERMPTLSEVLEVCKGKARLNIELKYYGHDQNLEQRVVDLVEEHGMADDIVIMSLKQAGIQKVKKLRPDWTVGLLTAVAASDITRAKADFLAVSTSLATHRFINSAHDRNKRVHVWTINDAPTMSLMIGRGADNLITDHPDLAKQVLEERSLLSPLERVLIEFSFLVGGSKLKEIEQ